MKKYGPVDAFKSPRFCGVDGFMRLPQARGTEDVDVAILGIPFDTASTYRVGSRFAPSEIRSASRLLRPFHPVHAVDIFEHCSVVDYGDADVVIGAVERTYAKIVDTMHPVFAANVIPIAMGGDHSVTLAELRAAHARYGKLALIHLDSHCDVWDEYFGEKFTHGTPFRRAAEEGLISLEHSIQAGMRGPLYASDDLDAAERLGFEVIRDEEMRTLGIKEVIRRIRQRVEELPVFLSFDIDFVDPAYAPGTGTPEVGGPSSRESLEIVRGLVGLRFAAFDLVEVIPQYDCGQITCLLAANLIYEFLSLVAKDKSQEAGNRGRR